MMSNSRTSLFSPGSTFHNSSPGGFDTSQSEWSKKSIDVINKQAQQASNSNYPDRRGMRRMISVDNNNNNEVRNYTQTPLVAASMQGKQFKEDEKNDGGFVLPQIQ